MSFGRWVKKGSTPNVATEKWPNRGRYEHLKESICNICLRESKKEADWEPGFCAFCGRLEPSYVKEAFCYFHEKIFGVPHPRYNEWKCGWEVGPEPQQAVDPWIDEVALKVIDHHSSHLNTLWSRVMSYNGDYTYIFYNWTFSNHAFPSGEVRDLADIASISRVAAHSEVVSAENKLHPVLIRIKEILVERGYR